VAVLLPNGTVQINPVSTPADVSNASPNSFAAQFEGGAFAGTDKSICWIYTFPSIV
jgi:hypothetical protein